MAELDHVFEFVNIIGDRKVTRLALERCKSGFFADKLNLYLNLGIICVETATDSRDDEFYLTKLGLGLWRQEISVKDIEGGKIG